VVQSNLFNQSKMHTALLCTITSNLNLSKVPGNVLLKQNEGRLPKPSVVNVAQIIAVDKRDLTEKIGTLSAARVRQIEEGIRLIIQSDM
jgi:mRNA interferase MazF